MKTTPEQFCHEFMGRFENVEWFQNIGQPLLGYDGPFRVKRAESIGEVYAGLKSDNWCNIDLEAFNKLCWSIRYYISPTAAAQGNAIAILCRKLFPMIEKKISDRAKAHGVRPEIKAGVLEALIRACQEQYFTRWNPVIRSDFSTNVLTFYRLGHIPCGWIGELVIEPYDPFSFAVDALNNEEDARPFNYASGELLVY